MKYAVTILILFLTIMSAQSQITGEFKNFNPKKHGNLEIKVSYYSSLDQEYIPLTTLPDSLGRFSIVLPYKNEIDLCFLSVKDRIYSTLVVEKGIHITLDAKPKKIIQYFNSGRETIFSGPDAEATIYFNKASKLVAKNYNRETSKIVFHSKDSANIRSARLDKQFTAHLTELDKYVTKNPSVYADITKKDKIAAYYSHQLIIHWGKPISDDLLNRMLQFSITHSSIYTNDFYSCLYNRLYFDDKDEYDHLTKVTIWDLLIADEREDFDTFFAEMRKKNKQEAYDERVYQNGKYTYLETYKNEVYVAHLSKYLEKIQSLSSEVKEKLLIASIPAIDNRSLFLTTTRPLLKSDETKRLYDAIETRDEKTTSQLLNMLADTDGKSLLGNLEAANTEVSMYFANKDSLDVMLQAIRNTYPNKVIILDIWGTWCGPCRNDILASKEKIKELKAQDIEVVYLCEGRNSKKSSWMESVLKMGMTGNQIYMSPSLSSQFLKRFNISGYPSHVFIDSSGGYHTDDEHFIRDLDVDAVVKEYR